MAEEESNDATAEADAEIEEEGQAAQVAHEAHHKPDRKGYWKSLRLHSTQAMILP